MNNSIFAVVDLFNNLFDSIDYPGTEPIPTNEFKCFYSNNFPPTNINIVKETKDLIIQMALAGYTKDEIGISFEDDKLILTLENKFEIGTSIQSVYQGIKHSNYKGSYPVPMSKYDVEKATADFNNGILEVYIPMKEESKPRKLEIKTNE